MPALVPPIAGEREGLLAYLAQQRHVVRVAAHGLTDEQARATPTAGALSVGGLIKHLVHMERGWVDLIVQRVREDEAGYEEQFTLGPGETLASVLDLYAEVAAETEEIVAGVADLAQEVPVPPEPWYPSDVKAWSVRWVLFHLIEETARHAGHADIVREAIDGATAFPLMAAAEGWPATEWLTPWEPPSA
ncbi:DinB family protein [Sinosporangium siamense]|uniref:DinB family protein n=1 Tax=Sinosporangium siamense TaxID=1367973 RepID=A0A919RL54_9ACTN|nr:DinB family protein [Sinosporangium siamense]GII94850.1 hypothetical protein Ssi02_50810 [Sinosporangium siamense]